MPNPIRTGYETIVAHVVDENFAYAAEDDGVVKELTKKYVTIEFKDGSQKQLEIGVHIASSKGSYYKHDIVCDLEVGHRFKKGDVIIFNESFFIRDILNPTQVIIRDRTYANVMIVDNNDTFEDSSTVYAGFSEHLDSTIVKERIAIIDAKDDIYDLVQVGQEVDIEDSLFYVQEEVFKNLEDKFGKHSSEVLQRMSRNAPSAGVKGKVVKVEMFYFCEEEDLSDSIRAAVNQSIKNNYGGLKLKASERRALSGQINEPLKFKSQMLSYGKVGIRIYIESKLHIGAGDKLVFGSQLKSVISRKFTHRHVTESGREIQAMFSYASISARIVASPEIMGTLYRLLEHTTIKALEAYDGVSDK